MGAAPATLEELRSVSASKHEHVNHNNRKIDNITEDYEDEFNAIYKGEKLIVDIEGTPVKTKPSLNDIVFTEDSADGYVRKKSTVAELLNIPVNDNNKIEHRIMLQRMF